MHGRIWLAQQCTGEGLEGAAHIGPGGRIWSRAKGAGMRQDAVNAAGTSGATLLETKRAEAGDDGPGEGRRAGMG